MSIPSRNDLPEPPPSPENQNLVRDLGLFHITWSILDMTMDAAIMKQLRLTALEGAVVCSGLAFERKSSILRSLLSLQSPTHDAAVQTLQSIAALARRNIVTHGHARVGVNKLQFVKIDTDSKLSGRAVTYQGSDLRDQLGRITTLIDALHTQLGISKDDINAIPNIGLSLTSKSATSPTSPSAKNG